MRGEAEQQGVQLRKSPRSGSETAGKGPYPAVIGEPMVQATRNRAQKCTRSPSGLKSSQPCPAPKASWSSGGPLFRMPLGPRDQGSPRVRRASSPERMQPGRGGGPREGRTGFVITQQPPRQTTPHALKPPTLFWPHLQCVEVPRPGIEPTPQQRLAPPHRQCWTLNPSPRRRTPNLKPF